MLIGIFLWYNIVIDFEKLVFYIVFDNNFYIIIGVIFYFIWFNKFKIFFNKYKNVSIK